MFKLFMTFFSASLLTIAGAADCKTHMQPLVFNCGERFCGKCLTLLQKLADANCERLEEQDREEISLLAESCRGMAGRRVDGEVDVLETCLELNKLCGSFKTAVTFPEEVAKAIKFKSPRAYVITSLVVLIAVVVLVAWLLPKDEKDEARRENPRGKGKEREAPTMSTAAAGMSDTEYEMHLGIAAAKISDAISIFARQAARRRDPEQHFDDFPPASQQREGKKGTPEESKGSEKESSPADSSEKSKGDKSESSSPTPPSPSRGLKEESDGPALLKEPALNK